MRDALLLMATVMRLCATVIGYIVATLWMLGICGLGDFYLVFIAK